MTIAIKIENLSKHYRLGTVSTRTLSHDLNRWWTMNIRGKDDPYLKIGDQARGRGGEGATLRAGERATLRGEEFAVGSYSDLEDKSQITNHQSEITNTRLPAASREESRGGRIHLGLKGHQPRGGTG